MVGSNRLTVAIFLIMALMALITYAVGEGKTSVQPPGVELNSNGESKIFWVFDTPEDEWQITGGPGSFVEGNPFGHCGDDYYAIDLARIDHNQEGQPVYPAISGTAYMFDYETAWGKEVIIYTSDSKFALRYAHLSEYDESLNGKWISAASNTPLGKVGHSGPYGTGPHLHIVLYKNVNTIEEGNPVRISSCSVQDGKCAKSATDYAAQFSFAPRGARTPKVGDQVTITVAIGDTNYNWYEGQITDMPDGLICLRVTRVMSGGASTPYDNCIGVDSIRELTWR